MVSAGRSGLRSAKVWAGASACQIWARASVVRSVRKVFVSGTTTVMPSKATSKTK
jgi:hypothetical protein